MRQRVYQRLLTQAGLPVRADYQLTAGLDVEEACQAALDILRAPEPPSAFFCDDDLLAAGAYRAARRVGLRIPADLSIIGFADSLVAQLLDPPLTTVSIPALEIGRGAMELLLTCLETNVEPFVDTIPLDFTVRGSTGAPPEEGQTG
jgi:LacI family repressor for deo operon, udp, cdd, tsx, nupC, and nupG